MPAGNIHKLMVPLDAEGLNHARPADQVLWRKLTNVVMRSGFIETRPGLVAVGPRFQDLTNLPGPIVNLEEVVQWQNIRNDFDATGSAVGGGIGTGEPNEKLKPTSDTGGSWTGTFADIDDDPPNNGSTKLVSTLKNDVVKLGFLNPTNAYDIIDGVFIAFRARSPNGGLNAIELAYGGRATTGAGVSTTPDADKLATLIVSNGPYTDDNTEGSEPGWMDYFIPVPVPDPNGNTPFWNQQALDALSLDIVVRIGTFGHITFVKPASTGTDNDFLPTAGETWKRGATLPDAPVSFYGDQATFVTGSTGDRISLVMDGLPSSTVFNSIDNIDVRFALIPDDENPTTALLYHRGTDGVRRTVLSATRVKYIWIPTDPEVDADIAAHHILSSGLITINPETNNAWTVQELKNGVEFGVEIVIGKARMTAGEVWVHGQASSDVVEIDNVSVIVFGQEIVDGGTGGDGSSDSSSGDVTTQIMGRVMATTYGWQRLVNEYADGSDTIAPLEDISAGVGFPERNIQPLESAIFFNRIYYQNGSEPPFYYGGKVIAQLGSSTPIGQSIWTFGQRLMQCDITETVAGVTTRHVKRVAFSGIVGPNEWQARDSGSFDLTDGGEGRARKGLALSSQMAAVYLDKGIYNLRWTGDSAAPFSPRLQDPDTGIIAPATCKPILDAGGSTIHMFFGKGPQGVNVYAYDGSQAHVVGGPIKDELNRLYRAGRAEQAFAIVEPRLNLYLLFLPETGQHWAKQAWVFSIDSNAWTRWEFPFSMTAAGQWTLFGTTIPALNPIVDSISGVKSVVLGTSVGIPYKFDFHQATDHVVPRTDADDRPLADFYDPDAAAGAQEELGIEWDIQTGDLVISQNDIIRQTAIKRLWITYEDQGYVNVEFSESINGGLSFVNATNVLLGTKGPSTITETDNRPLREFIVDFPLPEAARHHRIRIRPDQTVKTEGQFGTARQKFKLSKMVIEYEDLGEAP